MKMKSLLLILLLGIATGFARSANIPRDFEKSVEDLMNTVFLPGNKSPGAGLSVVTTDGSFVFTKGYGFSDIGKSTLMDENNLFFMASVSKSVCATLVARTLKEKFPDLGQLASLDTPVIKLAPQLNFTFIDRARAEHMSFRDLLSHRACLYTGNFGRSMGAFATTEEYIFRSRFIPEICPYRTSYNYNNAMFSVAGELIAQINGNRDYTEMLGNFLKELGMNDSFPVSKDLDYEKIPKLAIPYYLNGNNLVRSNPNLISRAHLSLGSGGVITSPRDISRYLLFQLNLGKLDGKQLVPTATMRWPRRPSNPFNFDGYASGNSEVSGDFAYGLGFRIGFYEGTAKVSHSGYFPPYASQISLYPGLDLGIFSSANGPGRLSKPDWPVIHDAIAALVKGEKSYQEIKADLLKKVIAMKPAKRSKVVRCKECIQVNPSVLPGVYGNPSQGDLEIVKDSDGTLRLVYGIWGRATIKTTSNANRYLLDWGSADVISDFYAESGSVPSLYLNYISNDVFYIEDSLIPYTRNATLNTLPEIPWSPGSCGNVNQVNKMVDGAAEE